MADNYEERQADKLNAAKRSMLSRRLHEHNRAEARARAAHVRALNAKNVKVMAKVSKQQAEQAPAGQAAEEQPLAGKDLKKFLPEGYAPGDAIWL